jgi:transposase InsO family protein
MRSDCKEYVRSCEVCNKNKKPNVKAKAQLGQYHAGVPLERIHMDILGPLPETKNGNKYILMIIDQFTKWIECFPLPNQKAEIIAKNFVDNVICRLGCPLELHTDQGKNMDGTIMHQICELLQIAKTRTTPYHPASNGQVERYNRTLLQALRCYIENKQDTWDEYLQQIAGAIRACKNRQTGFTPNEMMMGRDVLQPINLFLGTSDNGEDKDINTYVKDLKSKLESIHREARENLKTSQNRQKRDYDLRSVHNTYGVGDVVYKTNSATAIGKSPKLKSPWKGPYVITEIKSPVLYRIKDRKKEEVIHHDRIKLCQDRNHPLWLSRLRNKILKDHSSLETCNSDLEEYNLDTLFQLQEILSQLRFRS